MNIKDLHTERFRIPMEGQWARVIELVPDQILTRAIRHKVHGKDGWISLNPKEDLVILACVERHNGTGNVGLGLVKGFGFPGAPSPLPWPMIPIILWSLAVNLKKCFWPSRP